MTRARGRWRAAKYPGEFPSLGWDLRDLIETELIVPAGPAFGEPLVLTDEQVRFLVRLYRVNPRTGRLVYRRAVLGRSKGWGKSPFAGALAFGELVGPVVFAGWDAEGEPVGKPRNTPWIQLAAVAEDQTDNTYDPLYNMLADSPALDDFHIDLGKTRIALSRSPGKIERVTSEAGTREGQPITFGHLDQTETWKRANGGVELAATIRRNAAKNNCLTLETPNAYVPGDGSVAEESHKAGEGRARGLLYDNRPAPEVEDLGDRVALRAALKVAYGDSTWVDLDRLIEEINDPGTKAPEARRWWLNQPKSPEEAVVPIERWRELALGAKVAVGDEGALGFDGSVSRNATVLVFVRYPDVVAFPLGVWERPDDLPLTERWEVPRAEVHARVAWAMENLAVRRFYFDPPEWRDAGDTWSEEYGKDRVAKFETSKQTRMAPACDRFDTMVNAGVLHHDGAEVFERHLANARRAPVPIRVPVGERPPWVIAEKTANYAIDAVTALVVGLAAYGDALAAGEFGKKTPEPWALRM